MSENGNSPVGAIAWRDLTVDDADRIRRFYSEVVGWESSPVSMGEYNDFSMAAADGQTVAGICHSRGVNANIPPQWLIYITVDDADLAAKRRWENGGKVIDGPRAMGSGRFCIIQDPAGAVAALYAP